MSLGTMIASPLIHGGGDEKATVVPATNRYGSWGDEAISAKGEGWRPIQWDSEGTTVFRNPYDATMNNVIIPNDKNYGHIAAIGYKNGQFDLVIRDANGNIKQTLKKGVGAKDVRAYFTNNQSPIAKRAGSIIAGTNPDRLNASGGYTALLNPNRIK